MDKPNDIGIRLENCHLIKLLKEVMRLNEQDIELLNTVYREISEKLGMDTATEIYRMFKGQQINFPVRFFNPTRIRQIIAAEYDGTNVRTLAIKYNYSEKTIRRIIKDLVEV
jgi:Mor family transcriptional regulator